MLNESIGFYLSFLFDLLPINGILGVLIECSNSIDSPLLLLFLDACIPELVMHSNVDFRMIFSFDSHPGYDIS